MKIYSDIKCSNLSFYAFLGSTLALFVYVILRAYSIGFTHDESLTFTILIGKSNWILTANNHWVNTIFSFLSFQLFGSSEFALRLPNVLSFLIYSYYCYKLVVKNATFVLSAILSAIFLMLNPLVIELFALSRGYGLAMAFFSGSLYYFLKFHKETTNNKVFINGLILSGLTIYSNYSFIIPIIALNIGYLIHVYFEKQKHVFTKRHLLFFGAEVVAFLPALVNILILKKRNLLYLGGTENVIEDTLFSIFNKTFIVEIFNNQNWIILCLILVTILFGLIIKRQVSWGFLSIVLSAVFFIPVILHFMLGINYPVGRSALYWIVILGVYFHVFLENLFETKRRTLLYLLTFNVACISLLVAFSFFSTMNLTHTQTWKYDTDIRSMLETLNKDVKDNKKYSLGINWIFEPTINYYRKTRNYTFLEPVTRDGITNKEFDYYYIFDDESINIHCEKEIKAFSVSNTKLIQNCP